LQSKKASETITVGSVPQDNSQDTSIAALEMKKKSSETPRPQLKCNEKLELT
jgi:hypothetical protein